MHALKCTGWDYICCRQQVARDAHHDIGSTAREATAQSRRRAPGMLPVTVMVADGDSKRWHVRISISSFGTWQARTAWHAGVFLSPPSETVVIRWQRQQQRHHGGQQQKNGSHPASSWNSSSRHLYNCPEATSSTGSTPAAPCNGNASGPGIRMAPMTMATPRSCRTANATLPQLQHSTPKPPLSDTAPAHCPWHRRQRNWLHQPVRPSS